MRKLRFKFWLWRRMVKWRYVLMKATLDYYNNPSQENEDFYEFVREHLYWLWRTKESLT